MAAAWYDLLGLLFRWRAGKAAGLPGSSDRDATLFRRAPTSADTVLRHGPSDPDVPLRRQPTSDSTVIRRAPT